jgi:putative ABC transport system permease protein
MSLLGIAWRSIRQRLFTSGLTALSLALGVALVVATLVIGGVVRDAFASGQGLGYNLIVGAKGSPLQLVLNSVYLVSKPIENISWDFYQEFLPAESRADGKAGRYAGSVAKAVPICMGDYFKSFRVVGTNAAYFDSLTLGDGRSFNFAAGRNFRDDDFFGGVLGSAVAAKLGLSVGDTFAPTHGADDGLVHDPFTVTGILARTDTPVDRGVYVNMEGFYLQEGHAKPVPEGDTTAKPRADADPRADAKAGEEAGEALEISRSNRTQPPRRIREISQATKAFAPADPPSDAKAGGEAGEALEISRQTRTQPPRRIREISQATEAFAPADPPADRPQPAPLPFNQREVTAILVETASPSGLPPELLAMGLKTAINEGPDGQAAEPVREIRTLLDLFVRPLELLLLLVTTLVVIVSAIGILVSMVGSALERSRDVAVMRALGARRSHVLTAVLLEAIILAVGGGVVGWLLGHGIVAAIGPLITTNAGVSAGFFSSAPLGEALLVPFLVVLAVLAALLPALAAYRTDVAKWL